MVLIALLLAAGPGASGASSARPAAAAAPVGHWSPLPSLDSCRPASPPACRGRAAAAAAELDGARCRGPAPPAYCGTVLMAGGLAGTTGYPIGSAEGYRPGAASWSPLAPMPEAATGPAIPLPDGRVLTGGGLYDPAGGSWQPRAGPHGNVLILIPGVPSSGCPDCGKVLAYDGRHAALLDPAIGVWSPTLSRPTIDADTGFAATALGDGRVLIAGGAYGDAAPYSPGVRAAELYDPHSRRFSPTGRLLADHGVGHTLTLLKGSAAQGGGRVLLAGGTDVATPQEHTLTDAELYDPATGAWSRARPLGRPRSGHSAGVLADGRVLVVGGGDHGAWLSSAEVYDPVADSWTEAPDMASPRSGAAVVPLTVTGGGPPCDGVLVAGGATGPESTTASTELFSTGSGPPCGHAEHPGSSAASATAAATPISVPVVPILAAVAAVLALGLGSAGWMRRRRRAEVPR